MSNESAGFRDQLKFKQGDRKYLTARKEFSAKYGPRELWSVMDHWGLYCGISNLARMIAISDLFRTTLDVPGDIAEFGSWRGANLLFMAKLLRIFDPMCAKKIQCFDSFEGLTNFSAQDGKAKEILPHNYKGSLEELNDIIALYDMQDEVVLHKGYIENTLPPYLADNPSQTFSFVYFDADLYDATKVMLDHVHPRLAKGGMIVFDEWNYPNVPGEGVAANEFLAKHGNQYEVLHVRNTRHPSLAIRKVAY